MLAPDSVRVVRATADTVVRHGPRITGRFYDRMFEAHPELLELFNRGNQANGEQRQALAMSVAAVAGHFAGMKPVPLKAIVGRIAHKHASLGVTPSQYVVVGRHLMAAIGEVLGDAATPEVIAAWEEVFWLFACLLVAEESRQYERAGSAFGRPFTPHAVVDVHRDTEDVTSFLLEPDDRAKRRHQPGQYVSVAVELPGLGRQIRQYTVSSAPDGGPLRITVKRHRADGDRPEGMVSAHLHDAVRVGDRLQVSPPFGDLALPQGDSPLLLASAGVGTTPIVAALNHLVAVGSTRPVTVVHADRSPVAHPLRADLVEAVDRLPGASLSLWYEENPLSGRELPLGSEVREGLVDPDLIPVDPDAHALLCGPLPFMRTVRRALLDRGVPAERIHYEVFGPDAWLGSEEPSQAVPS
ncbi:globin domain-containing protein [Umezawaea sp. Da 62-37]|uniref:globin domain-containing protein n=1 Tax=Umezawaea sp. Da 62-37 TaxID=3075927 RepID=UPI0028F6C862|nr:globin domain-containing protein [Umezawaea sp. Da 62-37]WNV89065.1 globin domain-containing protein [Umezawaea sp. Da 62-37]